MDYFDLNEILDSLDKDTQSISEMSLLIRPMYNNNPVLRWEREGPPKQ